MGGQLSRTGEGGPTFMVSASQDAGTDAAPGMPLQRLQIVKGWLTDAGIRREEVFEVAGDPFSKASVDTSSCRPRGKGFAQLCAVWQDEGFDPEQRAWYYARAVENPSCRWSQRICVANGVDCERPDTIGEGLEGCCSDEHRPVVQERAWTSPIWYSPPG